MSPFNGITLLTPGRHADESKGGDFCVCIDDDKKNWTRHQFTHSDLFKDIEKKRNKDTVLTHVLLDYYFDVVVNNEHVPVWPTRTLPGVHPQTFLYGVLCLAVAEHRRYSQHEAKHGGRFLPLRFSAGIVEGLWGAADAIDKQRRGRPGVEWLEKDHGTPALTTTLMGV